MANGEDMPITSVLWAKSANNCLCSLSTLLLSLSLGDLALPSLFSLLDWGLCCLDFSHSVVME